MEPNEQQTVLSPQMRSVVLFLLLWQFLFNVSDAGLSVLIVFIFHLVKMFHSLSGNDTFKAMTTFPSTIQSIHNAVFVMTSNLRSMWYVLNITLFMI